MHILQLFSIFKIKISSKSFYYLMQLFLDFLTHTCMPLFPLDVKIQQRM